jgi:hypothetical protein
MTTKGGHSGRSTSRGRRSLPPRKDATERVGTGLRARGPGAPARGRDGDGQGEWRPELFILRIRMNPRLVSGEKARRFSGWSASGDATGA